MAPPLAPLPPVATAVAQERVALEALFNRTGGRRWTDSPENGWLQGTCHCKWVGVYCVNGAMCPDSPVIKIIRQGSWLGGQNLVGSLPSWNGDSGQGALPQLQVRS